MKQSWCFSGFEKWKQKSLSHVWLFVSPVWLFLYSPWNSPGQHTGVGRLFLLQRIFPIQGSNPAFAGRFFTSWATREAPSSWVDHNKLWKILKEMVIPDYLTCLLRNLYSGQEATIRTGYGTADWFKTGKGVWQGCIWSLCLFNLCAEYLMQMPCWINHKLESRLLGEISISSDVQMIPL